MESNFIISINNNILKKYLKLIFFIISIFLLKIYCYQNNKKTNNNRFNIVLYNNKYSYPKIEQNLTNLNEIYFSISDLNYSFSLEFDTNKIIYTINFYNAINKAF